MPLLITIMILISFIVFIITFFISFLSNLFWDALYRSVIVFIITFTLLYLFQKVVHLTSKKPNGDNQPLQHGDEVDEGATVNPIEQEETFKGTSIDLTTPDEDSAFKPFQPKKLNELDE